MMEKAKGNVWDWLASGAKSASDVREFAKQIAAGVAFLHALEMADGRKGVAHKDLKPPNILWFGGLVFKLADLGTSTS